MPVAAPIIGGVASVAGAALSKPKKQNDPNAYLTPYLQQGAEAAQQQFQSGGPSLWDSSTVAGPGDTTNAALQAQIQRGQSGSAVTDAAKGFVTNGLQQPISSQFGGANPYAASVGGGASVNPYAASVGGGSGSNPYATSANPFGAGQNPGLDAAFDYAAQKTRGQLDSEFAGSGRNISASAPARQDVLSTLAAQIYAPAYENERNRQLSYGQQQLGIGATGYENAQSRNLSAGLNAQNIGAQSFDNAQNRNLTANLAGQNIGAQGYENAQARQLADIQNQRANQTSLLQFATPLANQDYLDIQAQRDAGGVQDAYSQAKLSDEVARFQAQQNAPGANLDALLARLGGLKSATGPAVQQQQPPNYLAAGLGGALAANELFPYQQPQTTQPGNMPGVNYGYVPQQLPSIWGS